MNEKSVIVDDEPASLRLLAGGCISQAIDIGIAEKGQERRGDGHAYGLC